MWTKKFGMLAWVWIALVIIALDLYTKSLISGSFVYGEQRVILPIFNLTLLHNPGAAFSFLGDAGGWQRWLFTGIAAGVSLMLVVWLTQLKRDQFWLAIAISFILGGALGNLYDRLTLGYVVDFIQVHWQRHYFPAFNVADSAITVGAIMLIIDAIRGNHESSESE